MGQLSLKSGDGLQQSRGAIDVSTDQGQGPSLGKGELGELQGSARRRFISDQEVGFLGQLLELLVVVIGLPLAGLLPFGSK